MTNIFYMGTVHIKSAQDGDHRLIYIRLNMIIIFKSDREL